MNEIQFLKVLRIVIKCVWVVLTVIYIKLNISSIDLPNTYLFIIISTFFYFLISYVIMNLLKNT